MPSKYQIMRKSVHTMERTIVYGIRLDNKEPSFIFYHIFAHMLAVKAYTASLALLDRVANAINHLGKRRMKTN